MQKGFVLFCQKRITFFLHEHGLCPIFGKFWVDLYELRTLINTFFFQQLSNYLTYKARDNFFVVFERIIINEMRTIDLKVIINTLEALALVPINQQ